MATQETIQDPTGVDLKNVARAKQIAHLLAQGHTYTDIAKKLNITRPHLHALIRENPDLKNLIMAEITELETTLQTWIQNLNNSKSPIDRRIAAQELGKMVRHAKDKAYPTIFRHETLNINLDLNQLQQQQQIHDEAIARLPPTCRNQYHNNIKTIQKQWNTKQTIPP